MRRLVSKGEIWIDDAVSAARFRINRTARLGDRCNRLQRASRLHRLDDISMKPSLQFAISIITAILLTAAGKTVFEAQNLANGEILRLCFELITNLGCLVEAVWFAPVR
jgi:hypothetical protein